MTRQRETRRQFLRLTGGVALLGATGTASANHTTSDPVSGAPVPSNPGSFKYATMGTGGNPTATLYGNFKCPYTQDFVLNNLEAVVNEYVSSGDLDLRFRALAYQPPGTSSHGGDYYYISDSDPRISECAMGAWNAEPNEYWAFFRDMFENKVSGNVSHDDMRNRMAQSDLEKRNTAISWAKDGRYQDPVYNTRYDAGDYGVTFTPTLELAGDTIAPHHGTQDLLNWISNRIPEDGGGGGGGASAPGESGKTTVQQSPGDWFGVNLSRSYDSPVVISKSVSFDGPHPAHVRLRNVSGGSFDFRIEEWEYLDTVHTSETVGHVALDEGAHSLDGVTAEVGRTTTNTSFNWVNFHEFSSAPVVFSQAQTHNGPDAIVTRNHHVSSEGMDVRLQEQESNGWHTDEEIGFVAIEPGRGTLDGAAFEAGRTGDTVTGAWHRVSFDGSYSNPQFVADLQTYDGGNTAQVRHRNLTADGVDVRVEEERSLDSETAHVTESVGYLVFEG